MDTSALKLATYNSFIITFHSVFLIFTNAISHTNLWCCLLVPAARTLRKSLNLSLESVSRFPPTLQQRENRKRDWSHCMISASVLAGLSSIICSNSSSSITVFVFSSWGGSLQVRKTTIRNVGALDFTFKLAKDGLPLRRNFFVRTRVNRIEEMYGESLGNVKVEPSSTFTFSRGLSYIASILLAQVKKKTRKWKSTFSVSSTG